MRRRARSALISYVCQSSSGRSKSLRDRERPLYIFLDESGDLGVELSKPGTSQYFVLTLLLTTTQEARRGVEKAIERTVRNKMRKGKKGKIPALELKGTNTSLEVKQYFYR